MEWNGQLASWGCRPTYAVFPCKATFRRFWWSLWAFSPANLHTERPTWIQARFRVTHNASLSLKQKCYQSDKGAVDGWLPSAKRAHIWTFLQLTPSGKTTKFAVICGVCSRFWQTRHICVSIHWHLNCAGGGSTKHPLVVPAVNIIIPAPTQWRVATNSAPLLQFQRTPLQQPCKKETQ